MKRAHEAPSDEAVDAAEAQIRLQNKRIEFYITEYSIELLAQKMRSGEYVVPDYQREFTWELDRKSRFIESVLMGLPIPFLFFWEMPDGRLEIVDGSQRLRTLEEFVLGDLALADLKRLTAVSGFRFEDLPESRQRKMTNRSIRGVILNEHADADARFDMFERINTSSKIANPSEVRRGAQSGPFMDLVRELSEGPKFHSLAPVSKKDKKERKYEELVTRFFGYGDGLDDYRDRPADFLFNYVGATNERFAADPDLAVEYRQRFEQVMSFVERNFPHGFRRVPKGTATPNVRFEAIAIGTFEALRTDPGLLDATPEQLDVDAWIDSEEFRDVTGGDGANAVSRLRNRISFVRDKLLASV